MQRILITGCGGMLGDAVYHESLNQFGEILATDINVCEEWLSYMDIRDMHQCTDVVMKFRPTLIIHLAANTDLELCEKDPAAAVLTNTHGTVNMAILAGLIGAELVYISTAGVFDGQKDIYFEDDKPNPINVYGSSKLAGEYFVERHLTDYYIFRAGWMMGGGPRKDKKFINKIFKQIKSGSRELYVVDDKLGTPTYTVDFARNVFRVVASRDYGLYHQVCGGLTGRFEVANEFVKLLGLSADVTIKKVPSGYFSKEYSTPRPDSERLINARLDYAKLNGMRDWRVCLAEYSNIFRDELQQPKTT